MNIGTNGQVLAAATKELERKWRQTRETWRDAKSMEFEEQFLTELFVSVEKATTIMEELGKVLTKARNDCE
jgi:hypothetical protein